MTPSTVMAVVLISLAISSTLRHDVPQLGREGIRIPSLSVLAAEEAAVVAGEDHRLGAEPLSDGESTAVRQLSLRLRTGGHDDSGGCGAQGVDVGLVLDGPHQGESQERVGP
jgi:hypothetical protein